MDPMNPCISLVMVKYVNQIYFSVNEKLLKAMYESLAGAKLASLPPKKVWNMTPSIWTVARVRQMILL